MRLSLIFCFKNVHTGTKESTRYASGAHVYLYRDPKRRLRALKKAHVCRLKKKSENYGIFMGFEPSFGNPWDGMGNGLKAEKGVYPIP